MEGNSGRQSVEAAKLKGMCLEQSEGIVGNMVGMINWGISFQLAYYII